jgi:hypothetical protein
MKRPASYSETTPNPRSQACASPLTSAPDQPCLRKAKEPSLRQSFRDTLRARSILLHEPPPASLSRPTALLSGRVAQVREDFFHILSCLSWFQLLWSGPRAALRPLRLCVFPTCRLRAHPATSQKTTAIPPNKSSPALFLQSTPPKLPEKVIICHHLPAPIAPRKKCGMVAPFQPPIFVVSLSTGLNRLTHSHG